MARLVPPNVLLYRTRSQQFDGTVLDAVIYRRLLLARSDGHAELSELVFDVVVEELAESLDLDPESVDSGYGGARS